MALEEIKQFNKSTFSLIKAILLAHFSILLCGEMITKSINQNLPMFQKKCMIQ